MKTIIFFFVFAFSGIQLSAQFNGGVGDGSSKSYTAAVTLSGEVLSIYNGGNNDGAYRALQVSITMQEGCDYNIVVAGASGTQLFQAENNITVSGIIDGTNLIFKTGNEVDLLTSFEVINNGGVFQIEVASCPE